MSLSAEPHDVVIAGGGIAGLVAAWELRDLDVVVLEEDARVGGRIKSEPRGDYWVSLGAHMFPPPGSVIGGLVQRLGLEVLPITGSLLNMSYRGRLVRDTRPELFPFKLPMSASGRVSFARAGLKVRRMVGAYTRASVMQPGETPADVRRRLLQFGGDRSFAEFLGPLHPEAEEIFRATCNRSVAEPDELSVAAMGSLFSHVWEGGDLGLNMRGGSGELPAALADALGERVRLSAPVVGVQRPGADGRVTVRFSQDGQERSASAAAAILALPAPRIPALIADIPGEARRALEAVRLGPFLVASILTREQGPMPYDDMYSVLTVGRSFNMLFNHANCLRTPGSPRRPGGVLMVYAGGDRARALMDSSDEEVRNRYLDDVYGLFPEVRGQVEEVVIQRWPQAAAVSYPGRYRVQDALERGIDERILFAGDWMGEFPHMEAAAQTAVEAAARVRGLLRAGR